MSDRRLHGRWYWHCRACDVFVPRELQHCGCGAPKVRRSLDPMAATAPDRILGWEAGAVLLAAGLGLLWLLLE